ncbi:MAG: hypothetical protein LAN37_02520 [Acidobacteriia bacterium]|nr:hypothetical protein [Terriglobia bacterium]
MFIGHFGVALAAKKFAPRTSLGTLIVAAEFLDVLWPVFLVAGVEHVRIAPGITKVNPLDFYDYPVSHSLVATSGWAAVFALLYFALRKYKAGALVCGALVLSHWFLDALVHRPDLPVGPRGPYVGLGLWNSVAASVAAELALFVIGLALYLGVSKPMDAAGRWGFGSLFILLLAIWGNSLNGTPPPNLKVLEIMTFSLWLTFVWAWWADKHRVIE